MARSRTKGRGGRCVGRGISCRIPLLAKEGWLRTKKMVPFRKGADGVVSSAKTFRPEDFAELTTPSAALRWLRDFLLMPQPPLLCKEGNKLGHIKHFG